MKKLMLLLSLFAVIPAVAYVDANDPDFNYYDNTGRGYGYSYRGSRGYSREECPGGVCRPRRFFRGYRTGGCVGGNCPRRSSYWYGPRYYREEAPVRTKDTLGMAYPYGNGYWGPKTIETEPKEALGVAYPYGDGSWGPKYYDND